MTEEELKTMKNEINNSMFCGFLLGVFTAFVFSAFLDFWRRNSAADIINENKIMMQKEAIRLGYAEYDSQTGVWKWKQQKPD